MSKIIVLMGAPGAGKGTQARLLQERRSLPQISTGDMFRAIMKTETPLAEELRPILKEGVLVPDELTRRTVRARAHVESRLPRGLRPGRLPAHDRAGRDARRAREGAGARAPRGAGGRA